jgi:hypothetical protein
VRSSRIAVRARLPLSWVGGGGERGGGGRSEWVGGGRGGACAVGRARAAAGCAAAADARRAPALRLPPLVTRGCRAAGQRRPLASGGRLPRCGCKLRLLSPSPGRPRARQPLPPGRCSHCRLSDSAKQLPSSPPPPPLPGQAQPPRATRRRSHAATRPCQPHSCPPLPPARPAAAHPQAVAQDGGRDHLVLGHLGDELVVGGLEGARGRGGQGQACSAPDGRRRPAPAGGGGQRGCAHGRLQLAPAPPAGAPRAAASRLAAAAPRHIPTLQPGTPRTWSNSTRLFTFSFTLPLLHFCGAGAAGASAAAAAAAAAADRGA